MLTIDGAYGEGGGQVIRTTLTLATLLTQPVCLKNIRAKRKNPGLAAQHLTAVRASAMICDAEVSGDVLGSTQLTFVPQTPPVAGIYEFDVAEARSGGSAGAATLVLQTILLPLVMASPSSEVTLRGGTHVAWSPSFHYIRDVYLPMLARLGVPANATLSDWGWYPAGEGEIKLQIPGRFKVDDRLRQPESITNSWPNRGQLKQLSGIAVASSLPAHIAQRMHNKAMKLLEQADFMPILEPQRVRSVSPGAGIFLKADYEYCQAGFSALGKKGKPAEQVAEEAIKAFLAFHHSGALFDPYLVDQLLLPLALVGFSGLISAETLSLHTRTNLWVIEQFLGQVARINEQQNAIEFIQRDNVRL